MQQLCKFRHPNDDRKMTKAARSISHRCEEPALQEEPDFVCHVSSAYGYNHSYVEFASFMLLGGRSKIRLAGHV